MGGTNFETTATGKTAREAFANAVSQAQWEHGHGGYTGTIAEKPGFTEFSVPLADLPPREQAVERWNKEAKAYTTVMEAERVTDRLHEAIYHHSWGAKLDEISVPRWVKPEDVDDYIKREKDRFARVKADIDFFVAKMGLGGWKQMCKLFDNKWGNAVAIKLGDEEWLFCGIASC